MDVGEAAPVPPTEVTFGIVTPAYNRPHALRRAIESVQAQSHQHWRLVIVDDSGAGSVTEGLGNGDQRITTIVNEVNSGTNRSRNLALDELAGTVRYVTFLDDDDRFAPDALAVAAQYLSVSPVAWAASRRVSAASGASFTSVSPGQTQYEYIDDCMIEQRFSGDATHFVSDEVLRSSGARFPAEAHYLAEWRFWATVGSLASLHFFEGAITLGAEYGAENQSSLAGGDVAFRTREVADLCRFFRNRDVPIAQRRAARVMLRGQIALVLPRTLAARRIDLMKQIASAARPQDLLANTALHRRLSRFLVVGTWHRAQRAMRWLQPSRSATDD